MSFTHEGKELFGKHLLIDVEGCNGNLESIEHWKSWFKELLKIIDMKPYGELVIDEFGEGDLLGVSAVQLIYTSCITMHTYYKNRGIYLDVFSCKDYDEKKVIGHVMKHFEPNLDNIKYKIIYR